MGAGQMFSTGSMDDGDVICVAVCQMGTLRDLVGEEQGFKSYKLPRCVCVSVGT